MAETQMNSIPTRSWGLWIILLSLLIVVLGLTMWKDWWLTGEEPALLFYAIVPPVSILGAVLAMFWVVKVRQISLSFLDLLAIMVGVNLVMQGMEILLKIIYYLLWEYPGWLYLVIVIPAGFLLGAYGLVRWGRVSWGKAVLLMAVGLAGELLAIGLVTSLLGISTPGS